MYIFWLTFQTQSFLVNTSGLLYRI